MALRVIHLIHSECEIHVQNIALDCVRVRLTEKDPSLSYPTDFEIEGSPEHICEALASVVAVLSHMDSALQEPS